MLSPELMRLLAGALATLVLILFVFLYGRALVITWCSSTPPTFSAEYVYVAIALAGLVGGVVASVFGANFSEVQRTAVLHQEAAEEPSWSGPKVAFKAIAESIQPEPDNYVEIISAAYVVAYILIGFASVATWIGKSAGTSDIVKNLALISFGVFLAIARSFFGTGMA